MPKIVQGMIAGLVGTLALSAIMIVKLMMGMMPRVDAIGMMSNIIEQRMAVGDSMVYAWVAHFIIGTVFWGGLTVILYGKISTSPVVTALIVAIGAWLLMMILVMPMAGTGLFGMNIGLQAPVATFVLHIVFGLAAGYTFSALVR